MNAPDLNDALLATGTTQIALEGADHIRVSNGGRLYNCELRRTIDDSESADELLARYSASNLDEIINTAHLARKAYKGAVIQYVCRPPAKIRRYAALRGDEARAAFLY